jgi:hypothetical protein
MKKLWHFGPWLTRLVLLAVAVIFTVIGYKYLTDPVGATAPFKIHLGSAAAVTNMRVGFGAFPIAFALIALVCLLSEGRLLVGLYFVVATIGIVTAVRIFGLQVDGAAVETLKVLRPELVLLALSTISLFLEVGRQRALKENV